MPFPYFQTSLWYLSPRPPWSPGRYFLPPVPPSDFICRTRELLSDKSDMSDMSDLTLVCSGPLVSATALQTTLGSPEGYPPLVAAASSPPLPRPRVLPALWWCSIVAAITTPAGATRPLVAAARCYPPYITKRFYKSQNAIVFSVAFYFFQVIVRIVT